MKTILDSTNPAELQAWRGRGNPTACHISSAISNCFPGLEFDFRAVWKRIFESVDLHEASGTVTDVKAGGAAEAAGVAVGDLLSSVEGVSVRRPVSGPDIPTGAGAPIDTLEWSNSLAILFDRAGQDVACRFQKRNGDLVSVMLRVRALFDGAGLTPEAGDAGVLTQGLCSPWQSDYRECGCYYWAASRPDYVNVEINGADDRGHNWLSKDRTPDSPKDYREPDQGGPVQVSYEDLYRAWETELRFLRRGQDSE